MTASAVGFLLCAAVAVVLVVQGQQRPDRIAPIDDLLDRVMASRTATVVIVLFWWWLGWHVFVAQTVDP